MDKHNPCQSNGTEIPARPRKPRSASRSTSTAPASRPIHTGVGFFDHMLDLLGRHSLIDLTSKPRAICRSMPITPSKTSASSSARPSRKRSATSAASTATAGRSSPWTKAWPRSRSICPAGRRLSSSRIQRRIDRRISRRTGRRILQIARDQREDESAHRRSLRHQQPPHRRGDLQSDRPGAAAGGQRTIRATTRCRAPRDRCSLIFISAPLRLCVRFVRYCTTKSQSRDRHCSGHPSPIRSRPARIGLFSCSGT